MTKIKSEHKGDARLQENDFLEQVSSALDKSCDSIDGYTQSRLTRIRHQALDRTKQASRWKVWGPVGAAGLACSMVLVLNFGIQSQAPVSDTLIGDTAIEDLDLLTADEGLEFFEDLEFYQWLAENDFSA